MSETTPGRAAYEAYDDSASARDGVRLPPWPCIREPHRGDWDAAAEAAIEAGPNAPQRLANGNEKLRAERDQLRALAAEILGAFDPSKGDGYRARVGQVQIAKWRQRAGLEADQ